MLPRQQLSSLMVWRRRDGASSSARLPNFSTSGSALPLTKLITQPSVRRFVNAHKLVSFRLNGTCRALFAGRSEIPELRPDGDWRLEYRARRDATKTSLQRCGRTLGTHAILRCAGAIAFDG